MTDNAAVVKTEEELQREIDELYRQKRQITERLRDPRGLRRGAAPGTGPRGVTANGGRRGFLRPADRSHLEEQPAKRRLLSAIVKVEDGEIIRDPSMVTKDTKRQVIDQNNDVPMVNRGGQSLFSFRSGGGPHTNDTPNPSKKENLLPVPVHPPRAIQKTDDPNIASRNKRMFGQLLGTLEKFRKEDVELSCTEAFKQRSLTMQMAEQKAREESERLRRQEREQIAEKRKRDLILRARLAAKAEEKKLDLLFLRWSEHHKTLSTFLRTKHEPPIYYLPKLPTKDGPGSFGHNAEKVFSDWRASRKEELLQFQRQMTEQFLNNAEKVLERWQSTRRARVAPGDPNLQETMDRDLDNHLQEHGPKRNPATGDEDDDVEDINAVEEDTLEDVLVTNNSGPQDLARNSTEQLQVLHPSD